jgi:hypothetical protein
LFKQEEEDSFVVMSGTRVKFVGFGGEGRKKATRTKVLEKNANFVTSTAISPLGNCPQSLEASLSLSHSQVPRDPRSLPALARRLAGNKTSLVQVKSGHEMVR